MTLAAPALRLMLRVRVARGMEIADRVPERRGIDHTRRPNGPLLWLHAASVGEVMSLLPVLDALATLTPGMTTLMTSGTVTSARLLEQRLPQMGLARRVLHRFVPLDVPAWVARFLDHWRPDAAGFVESELWPNILMGCQVRGIPAMLINARMSERSFNSWSRFPGASRFVLGGFARIHARSEVDAARLRALGARQVEMIGDLKLAAPVLPADPAILRHMETRFHGRPVFLAASTHPGEENLIRVVHETLSAHHSGLLTIIAPRHPERGPELSQALRAPSRQRGEAPPDKGIWIADTLGELGLWYRLCQVAFVGRSLIAPGGGQNPLEPARLGCVIATGPHTSNFTEHVALLREAGALEVTADVPALATFTGTMLSDPEARARMGERAKEAVKASGTVTDATARALLELMGETAVA
ncbi:MAG: 3-deoxy-D-manno-octulosonic acid transferase [Acetobacteraceae bacterium]|nr:3-deoxy-D-manno-octulosonic acid transferase [Acetobacteraceae bacterium]